MNSSLVSSMKNRINRGSDKGGFSLIELLVVILIIGILSAIAIPIFLGQQDQAKDAAAKSDLANAKVAMISYSVSNGGSYASTTTQLSSFGFVETDGVTVTISATPVGPFCLQATSASGKKFHVTATAGVVDGICPTS